jgi:hypothetical protein
MRTHDSGKRLKEKNGRFLFSLLFFVFFASFHIHHEKRKRKMMYINISFQTKQETRMKYKLRTLTSEEKRY